MYSPSLPPSRRGGRTARRNDGQPEGAARRASPAAGYGCAAGRCFRISAEIAAQASCPYCLTIALRMSCRPVDKALLPFLYRLLTNW